MIKSELQKEDPWKLREELIKVKYQCYQKYLRILDDEFLGYEFADRIGNENKEFEDIMYRGGVCAVIDYLEDHMANKLYDDPMMDPINREYWEKCKSTHSQSM